MRLFLFLGAIWILPAAGQSTSDPLDWNHRWDSYVQRTFGWKRIAVVSMETAFDQTFELNRCGRPPYCFPRELGGALTRRTARTTIELGVGALLHEDIRRSPSNLTGFRKRVEYALIHAPLGKNSDGEWGPAYSRFAGSLGGAVVSAAYRDRPITAGRMAETMGWSFAAYFEDALWAEFEPDLKRLGKRAFRKMSSHRNHAIETD